jgi:hypothetical protein
MMVSFEARTSDMSPVSEIPASWSQDIQRSRFIERSEEMREHDSCYKQLHFSKVR